MQFQRHSGTLVIGAPSRHGRHDACSNGPFEGITRCGSINASGTLRATAGASPREVDTGSWCYAASVIVSDCSSYSRSRATGLSWPLAECRRRVL